MIRVMLVDDQRLARLGFQLMLDDVTGIEVIAQTDSGHQAIDTLKHLEKQHQPLPNVILMDVRMPGMDGIQATRQIAKQWPSARILILTTYDEDDYAYGGLDAGASGFLLKDATKRELTDAIQAVAAGDAILTPRITKQVLSHKSPDLMSSTQQQRLRKLLHSLTPRQREICSLIAKGLSNEEIATTLTLETSTVKRVVSTILSNLQLNNRTQIAVAWFQAGAPWTSNSKE